MLIRPQFVTAGPQTWSFNERILLNSDCCCDTMIEPLLCGIVLGLIPVTLMGLFVAAWNQYRRGGNALGG